MIVITKNTLNKVCLTLTEKAVVGEGSDWLFVFSKEQASIEYKFFSTDISTVVQRYNLFEITEGVDVTIKDLGDYDYWIYQMPDTDDTDETRGNLVEVGKCKVLPEADETINSPSYDDIGVIFEE